MEVIGSNVFIENIKEEIISEKVIEHALDGFVDSSLGQINRIKTNLLLKDILGCWGVRWGFKRKNYKVPVGLYAIGNPDKDSHVLVTANYKATFDALRKELDGLDVWLLVLDTKGINVWCAAGKGTFGSDELINRIRKTNLDKLVSHKKLILPQLGAPGVSAQKIRKSTGFNIIYGPVRAEDLKAFLKNSCRATREMRRVRFDFTDRLVLTPLEVILHMKYFPIFLIMFLLLNYLDKSAFSFFDIFNISVMNSFPYFGAILIGSIIFPLLLPVIPFRLFSIKGALLGIIWSSIVIMNNSTFIYDNNIFNSAGHALLLTTITSYLSLNFTGCTTFTSYSGVQKETLWAIPVMLLSALSGIILLFIEKMT